MDLHRVLLLWAWKLWMRKRSSLWLKTQDWTKTRNPSALVLCLLRGKDSDAIWLWINCVESFKNSDANIHVCVCIMCVCAWVWFREEDVSLTKQNHSADGERDLGSVKDTPGERMLCHAAWVIISYQTCRICPQESTLCCSNLYCTL